jgi:hypothetical protein
VVVHLLTKYRESCLTLQIKGRVLETSLAKPPTEKRPLGLEPAYPPQRAGLLPQYQARGSYGYAPDVYGGVGGYAPARDYTQVSLILREVCYFPVTSMLFIYTQINC